MALYVVSKKVKIAHKKLRNLAYLSNISIAFPYSMTFIYFCEVKPSKSLSIGGKKSFSISCLEQNSIQSEERKEEHQSDSFFCSM